LHLYSGGLKQKGRIMRSIHALYDQYETVDQVVEVLQESGIPMRSIVLKSGDQWGYPALHASEPLVKRELVYLQVQIPDGLEKQTRELVCNSGPVDVREEGSNTGRQSPRMAVVPARQSTPIQPK
jgi:hypothetical protein